MMPATEASQRASRESWARVLRGFFAYGLKPWKVTVAYGHLGIWSARGELCADGEDERCWNRRLVKVIDQLPKKEWPTAKGARFHTPRAAWSASNYEFAADYRKPYPEAV